MPDVIWSYILDLRNFQDFIALKREWSWLRRFWSLFRAINILPLLVHRVLFQLPANINIQARPPKLHLHFIRLVKILRFLEKFYCGTVHRQIRVPLLVKNFLVVFIKFSTLGSPAFCRLKSHSQVTLSFRVKWRGAWSQAKIFPGQENRHVKGDIQLFIITILMIVSVRFDWLIVQLKVLEVTHFLHKTLFVCPLIEQLSESRRV